MPAWVLPMFGGKNLSSGGPKEIYSENLYVLEYLSDNCYVIFNEWMQSFGSKGLGAWDSDEILSILRIIFYANSLPFFLRFCLGANRIVVEARTV